MRWMAPAHASRCQGVNAVRRSRAKWEPSAMPITTIGLDLAKSIFQVHGVDATGQVVVRKSLRRSQLLPFFAKLPACLVGIEACGTSHHWARELIKLGHEVRLMPPAYVKPYVKRGKTDAADAEAVCEAVTRPTMRFVPVKSPQQQAALSMHRTRDLLVKQRTQLINMIRGLLAEFGVDIPKGLERALLMARQIVDGKAPEVPIEAAKMVGTLSQPGTIPAAVPYLAASAERQACWRDRLPPGSLRAGFVWSGQSSHKNDSNRSIALPRLSALFENPQIRCFSLQRDLRDADGEALRELPNLVHLGADLRDFADTAAII